MCMIGLAHFKEKILSNYSFKKEKTLLNMLWGLHCTNQNPIKIKKLNIGKMQFHLENKKRSQGEPTKSYFFQTKMSNQGKHTIWSLQRYYYPNIL